jgi:hypothetical protein
MNAVDDLDATIKGCRTAAWTLALGSLVLVAALSWQPLALLVDTMMWPNFAMGCLSQVALIACAAGSCVMITTVASGDKPAVTRRFAIAQYKPCGRFRGGEPGDVLRRRTAVRVVPTGVPEPEPCLIVVASAVVVRAARVDSDPGVVGGHALFEPLSSYANAYANQLGCVFGCPPMFTNRLDLQKPDTGGRRRSPFAYLGAKWSQVQILSARPKSSL